MNDSARKKSRRRLVTLEAKLALITTLVVICVAGALFLVLSASERARLVQAKSTAATMLIRLLSKGLAPAIDFGDARDVAQRLDDLRGNSDIVSAAVWAKGDALPLAAWNARGVAPLARPTEGESDGAPFSKDALTATATIRGPSADVLGKVRIALSLRAENDEFSRVRERLFWVVSGIAAATALLLAALGRRYVAGPLARLAEAASALAEGDVGVTVDAGSNDEIGDLARAFDVMRTAVLFREEQLHKEIDLAQRIQTSLLPRDVSIPGLDVGARMVPASQVGGDYYDMLPLPDGAWIGIGDVAGHGLDAGLIMLMMQSVVASLVTRDPGAAPSSIVCLLNEILYVNVRQRLCRDTHATFTLLRYDRSGRIAFAGAHEDVIVYRADQRRAEVIATPGTWVGGRRDIRAGTVDSTVTLAVGDVLLLHTDGATEIRNESGEMFGDERLVAELETLANEPAHDIAALLSARVLAWGKAEDDVTFLAFRYTGS